MAGGIGSRFWPVSTAAFPKQFHDILGTGHTLLQQTFQRLRHLTSADKILVVTHKRYAELVAEQLPDMPRENIILEPARRNTAPCITYAAYRIYKRDPQASMLVAPSDHLITDDREFERVARLALETAASSPYLLTLGITPHRPDTGYGYIQFSEQQSAEENSSAEVKIVKTFTEKPDADLAQQFLDSGDFLWNSGIFIWNLTSFFSELAKHQPDLISAFNPGLPHFGSEEEHTFVDEIYPSCPNESIDYGLMEKSSQVYVIPADFGWSDLGTWGSLYSHSPRDEEGNAIQGKRVLAYDCQDSIIRVPSHKSVVIDSLEDYIVIDTEEALLICPRAHEQHIKSYVNELKIQFGDNSA